MTGLLLSNFEKEHKIEFPSPQSYDDVDGGAVKNKILRSIQREAQSAETWLNKLRKDYSKDNFKPDKTSFLRSLTPQSSPYTSPIKFELFKLPTIDQMALIDDSRLEVVRRIFEQLKKILPALANNGEKAAGDILARLGDLTNPNQSMTKLDKVLNGDPSSVKWNVPDQDLDDLKKSADNLDKTRWPTLKDTSNIPKDQIVDRTRTKLIMLTIISQLFGVMNELRLVAGANIG